MSSMISAPSARKHRDARSIVSLPSAPAVRSDSDGTILEIARSECVSILFNSSGQHYRIASAINARDTQTATLELPHANPRMTVGKPVALAALRITIRRNPGKHGFGYMPDGKGLIRNSAVR